MTRRFFILVIALLSLSAAHSQLLKWSPAFLQEGSSAISITANATLGNKGLLDYAPANDVFVHIGAITNLSTGAADWKYVKFTWGTTTGAANAGSTGSNQWTFSINGGLRSFFGITNSARKNTKDCHPLQVWQWKQGVEK